MIAKLKPPRKPKPDPKPISYPFYHQRRLYYTREQNEFNAPENSNPNQEQLEMPRLRPAAAGSIKFTPAVITPSKKLLESAEKNEAMELCAALNGRKSH